MAKCKKSNDVKKDRNIAVANTLQNKIAKLEVENQRLRAAVQDMDCTCLPYTDIYPSGKCSRCRALEGVEE